MKITIECNSTEEDKLNLMLTINKIVADIKRGNEAHKELYFETKQMLAEQNQQSFLDLNKNKKIEAAANLKILMEKQVEMVKAIEKLNYKYSLIAVELEEKFNVIFDDDDYIYYNGLNIFEHIKGIKLVKEL